MITLQDLQISPEIDYPGQWCLYSWNFRKTRLKLWNPNNPGQRADPSDPSTFANFRIAREACILVQLMGVITGEDIDLINGIMIASGRKIEVRGFQLLKKVETEC